LFLLSSLPKGVPELIEIPELDHNRMEKLAATFGTMEKVQSAIGEYLSAPR